MAQKNSGYGGYGDDAGNKKNLTHDCAIPPVTTIYERLLADTPDGGRDAVVVIRPPRGANHCTEKVQGVPFDCRPGSG